MRIAMIAATCLALAACGSKEQPAAEATPTEPAATTAAIPAPGTMTGRYEVKDADGVVTIEQINADGTYTDSRDGKVVESGTWRADGAKMCFDAAGDTPESCYTSSAPGPDGSFKVIGADGKETGNTVRKVAEAPAAP